MRPRWYRRDGTPYEDFMEGAREIEKDRVVKQEMLPNGYWVSTVFLSLDHQHFGGPPLIFETMVADPKGEFTDYQERYSTEQEALEGHQRAVALFEKIVDQKEQNE